MPTSNLSKDEVHKAVNAVRKARSPTEWAPISTKQANSLKERPVRGPIWASRTTFSSDGCGDVLRVVNDAILNLAFDPGHDNYKISALADVDVEWIGYRSGVGTKAIEPKGLSEADKYKYLIREVRNPRVILYLFGGNLHVGSSSTYRSLLTPFAALTGSRILIVNYRLAPKYTFPSPLVEALVAYLSLLYPPPDAFHTAIPASDIIFAGDSAGANLCLSLVQIILSHHCAQTSISNANNTIPRLNLRGQDYGLPLPRCLTLLSAAPDFTGSMWAQRTSSVDILELEQPCLNPAYPSCELWPSDPPRANLYCAGSMLSHPLVSPITAPDWAGACPVSMFIGAEERANADARFLAKYMAEQGVKVRWEEHEAMPHIWPFVFPNWTSTRLLWERWSRVCGEVKTQDSVCEARVVRVPDGIVEAVKLETLSDETMESVRSNIQRFQERQKPYVGKAIKPSL